MEYQGSEIKLEKVIKNEEKFTSWLFSFQSDGQKVTGMLNLPLKQGKMPVIVMLRGYADDTVYFTGLGTRKGAAVFAQNGFITIAPDFLGFGGSDTSSADILEARFERPVTVLNLLASLKSLPQADTEEIMMWGHSNGGQIALSVLEISQKPIPTTLWAPVTKGFPQSVLQYMTEMDDQGLKVKKAIDDFQNLYDSNYYSIDHYWTDIQAAIQVHQGVADEYIDTEWTDNFVKILKDLGKSITYYQYPGNDHNLSQDWETVVQRDLEFFKKSLMIK
jgi:dipeptidyl aminopeptidase/acylaminoacyl peptidase